MYLLGIDIGGTKCAVVLGREKERDGILILDKITFPTLAIRGAYAIIDEIASSADIILERNKIPENGLAGIGISCGGPLDSAAGLIQSPPNLPGWDNIPIVEIFTKRYGVKTTLQNDANACALAEWRFGAARGYKNIIFLTFGTGMGAGLILDGALYSGTNGMAGEVGHIRLADTGPEGYGKAGSFEGFCSGGGVARMGREMSLSAMKSGTYSPLFDDLTGMTAKLLAAAARDGDAFAKEVYERCAEKLGLALSILIDIINPEIIVIGGIYARGREMFDSVILPVIEREALAPSRCVCKIVPARLGEEIGDYAALALALK